MNNKLVVKNILMKCRQLLRDETLDKSYIIAKVELEIIRAIHFFEKETDESKTNKVSESPGPKLSH